MNSPASISEIITLDSFKQEILRQDGESLVIFDVDGTLITPKDPFFRDTINLPENCRSILQHFKMDLFLKEEILKHWNEYWISKIFMKMEFLTVDPEFSLLVQELQDRRINTIAITAITPHSFGLITSMADWRIKQLKQLNFDFGLSFKSFSPSLFLLESGNPVFKNGIIFSDTSSKEKALAALLEAIKWLPSKIVFIDDRMHSLKSVEEMAGKLGIPFAGFLYKGSEILSNSFDEEIAALRFLHLAEKGEWLTEQEAKDFFEGIL